MLQALKVNADLNSVLDFWNTHARALALYGEKIQAQNLNIDLFVSQKIRFRRKMLRMSQKH